MPQIVLTEDQARVVPSWRSRINFTVDYVVEAENALAEAWLQAAVPAPVTVAQTRGALPEEKTTWASS